MSVRVLPSELRAQIDAYGGRAFLITADEGARTHVVSVVVRERDDSLIMGAGRRTSENIAANPAVTLLWPPDGDGQYSLIVDGDAAVETGPEPVITVKPNGAVLHRVADGTGDGPGCIPVLPAAE